MVAEDAKGGLSLVEYVRKQRRAECAVCSLPEPIRAEIRGATSKKIPRTTVLDWLHEVHKIELTSEAMTSHYSGHHDT